MVQLLHITTCTVQWYSYYIAVWRYSCYIYLQVQYSDPVITCIYMCIVVVQLFLIIYTQYVQYDDDDVVITYYIYLQVQCSGTVITYTQCVQYDDAVIITSSMGSGNQQEVFGCIVWESLQRCDDQVREFERQRTKPIPWLCSLTPVWNVKHCLPPGNRIRKSDSFLLTASTFQSSFLICLWTLFSKLLQLSGRFFTYPCLYLELFNAVNLPKQPS